MSEELKQIANRIKELRVVCDYSPEEIAEKINVDTDIYVGYENDGVDIPISVLYSLANIYKVDMTELLTGKEAKLADYCITRAGSGVKTDRYPGYSFNDMAYKFKNKIMEPLMVAVDPSDERPHMVSHPGQEFNYVIEGTVAVYINDKELVLEKGDCIYFDPTLPHAQRAIGGPAKFLTMIAER